MGVRKLLRRCCQAYQSSNLGRLAETRKISSAQQQHCPCLLLMRSYHQFQLSLSSNEVLFITTPPNFLLPLEKVSYPPWLSGLASALVLGGLCVSNCNSSANPDLAYLLLNYLCCLIFKIDSSHQVWM